MYMKKMVEVGRAANGFVIECRVPYKPKDKGKKGECVPMHESREKQFVAKDMDEAVSILQKILPMLDDTFSNDDEFNQAFEKAAK